jgi:hypothetical protein
VGGRIGAHATSFNRQAFIGSGGTVEKPVSDVNVIWAHAKSPRVHDAGDTLYRQLDRAVAPLVSRIPSAKYRLGLADQIPGVPSGYVHAEWDSRNRARSRDQTIGPQYRERHSPTPCAAHMQYVTRMHYSDQPSLDRERYGLDGGVLRIRRDQRDSRKQLPRFRLILDALQQWSMSDEPPRPPGQRAARPAF